MRSCWGSLRRGGCWRRWGRWILGCMGLLVGLRFLSAFLIRFLVSRNARFGGFRGKKKRIK